MEVKQMNLSALMCYVEVKNVRVLGILAARPEITETGLGSKQLLENLTFKPELILKQTSVLLLT